MLCCPGSYPFKKRESKNYGKDHAAADPGIYPGNVKKFERM